VLKVTNISQNTTLNAITVRDTPSVIDLTGVVVDQLDKAPPEIMVDVEILEISRTKFKQLGTALSAYSVGASIVQPDGAEGAPAIALPRLTSLDQSLVLLTLPSALFNFLSEDTETKTIARPQIRAQEAQQVTVRIGDQVPIPTTTFAQGVNQVTPITNFQYRDIGLNIDLTPVRIHHDGDTTITLTFQLNSITSPGSGTTPPTFGNRQVTSTIRLHDGETTLLSGLLQDEERTSLQGIPWLARLPVVGKLFGASTKSVTEKDIVLTLTPHIVRLPEITPADLASIYVGPESSLGTGGGGGPVPPTPVPTPAQPPGRTGRPAGPQGGAQQPDQPQNIFDIFRRQQEEQQKLRQQEPPGETAPQSPFGGPIQTTPPPKEPDDDNQSLLQLPHGTPLPSGSAQVDGTRVAGLAGPADGVGRC
jgi:general secretion pathway protein D